MTDPAPLPPLIVEPVVRRALEEDLGRAGDITTDSIVPGDQQGDGALVARAAGRAAGLAAAVTAFRLVDPAIEVTVHRPDGSDVAAGDTLATLRGPARGLLTGERVALNFLGRLCGIATATREAVRAVEGHPARIACTRKTTPGLRALEKHAVRLGGGVNHRFGLDDGVLIKDNHLATAGGVEPALAAVRAKQGHMVRVAIEVDTLDQLDTVLATGQADCVLLDNMAPDTLREAVRRANGRVVTEASGGLTPDSLRDVAASGVDIISLGWLTHSAPALDVALDLA